MNERDSWLTLNALPGISPHQILNLYRRLGNLKEVFSLSFSTLEKWLSKEKAERIKNWRNFFDLERELRVLDKESISVLTLREEGYPPLLKEIPDPPPVLYVKGEILSQDRKAIAIVGARNCSLYGKTISRTLAEDLASRGITIVSGVARGIDTFAHLGALESGGRTIGVLGSGLKFPYPPENKKLMENISLQGALISEFPLFTPPFKHNFPRRNRVISGLSLGVVIVEASGRSGALITASFALEQGREVFAVPGKVDSWLSEGTHRLIKEGAKLVDKWEDVWEELTPLLGEPRKKKEKVKITPEEEKVLKVLGKTPLHIDEIMRKSSLPSTVFYRVLLNLQLKGLIKELPGKLFLAH